MTIWTILLALLFLSLLIAIHELGHYTMGRIFKFTIEEFAIGMGPKLISRKSKKTGITYAWRALPIGGMCQFGEDVDDENAVSDPHHFNNNAWWKRALVLVAGAAMNLIFALVLAVILLAAYGTTDQSKVVAGSLGENSVAASAGMEVGDQFLYINGESIQSYEALDSALQLNKDTASMVMLRDGQQVELELNGLYDETQNKNFMGVGISFGVKQYSLFGAIAAAPAYCADMVKTVYQSLWMLITGDVSLGEMSGPVGVVRVISEFIPQGFEIILILLVLISVNLGVVNLLPLPALDGGRLLLVIIEGITGKRLPRKTEAIIHFVGFALLLLLIIFLTFNDVSSCIRG